MKAKEPVKVIVPEVTYVAMAGKCHKARNGNEVSEDHKKNCFHHPCRIRRRFASGAFLIENNLGYVMLATPNEILIVS